MLQPSARRTGLVQLPDAVLGVVGRGEGLGPGVRGVGADYRGRSIVLGARRTHGRNSRDPLPARPAARAMAASAGTPEPACSPTPGLRLAAAHGFGREPGV